MDFNEAIGRFAQAQAKAWDELANHLGHDLLWDDFTPPDSPHDPTVEHVLGARQLDIVRVEGLRTEMGLRTSEIARAIDYEEPNTYSTLQALARRGIVEEIPGKSPKRWRLTRSYRREAQN